jgi:hypothetical protein
VSGDVSGEVSGDVRGDVRGDVSGNVSGDVRGDASGHACATEPCWHLFGVLCGRTIATNGDVLVCRSFMIRNSSSHEGHKVRGNDVVLENADVL